MDVYKKIPEMVYHYLMTTYPAYFPEMVYIGTQVKTIPVYEYWTNMIVGSNMSPDMCLEL